MKEALLQHNIIYTDRLDEYGVGKFQFDYFVKTNHYRRIAKGTYKFEGDETYRFYLVYKKAPSGVLSHNTALYYHGLIDMPKIWNVTLSIGNGTTRFKGTNIKAFLIKKDLLEIGTIDEKDCFGNPYRVYDLDRTMVDLVRSRNVVGVSFVGEVLVKYLKREDKDIERLMLYAKACRVEKIMKNYLEILGGAQ